MVICEFNYQVGNFIEVFTSIYTTFQSNNATIKTNQEYMCTGEPRYIAGIRPATQKHNGANITGTGHRNEKKIVYEEIFFYLKLFLDDFSNKASGKTLYSKASNTFL